MDKNIKCPLCHANAFHIDRVENGKYILKCLTKESCSREINLEEDNLIDL